VAGTSERVGDAVVAVVGGAVGGLDPAPAVVKRKRPVVLDTEATPLVCVCVGDAEEMEPLCAGAAGTLVWAVRRPVAVAVAFKANAKTAENSDLRTTREAVWPAVTAEALTAAGLAGCNVVKPAGRPIFDPAGLAAGFDWSVLSLLVETLEEYPT
jgi:hypothetical protein